MATENFCLLVLKFFNRKKNIFTFHTKVVTAAALAKDVEFLLLSYEGERYELPSLLQYST